MNIEKELRRKGYATEPQKVVARWLNRNTLEVCRHWMDANGINFSRNVQTISNERDGKADIHIEIYVNGSRKGTQYLTGVKIPSAYRDIRPKKSDQMGLADDLGNGKTS